jgi:hypothetical protein
LIGHPPWCPGGGFFYSPDRDGDHPERYLATYAGLMQTDAYVRFRSP